MNEEQKLQFKLELKKKLMKNEKPNKTIWNKIGKIIHLTLDAMTDFLDSLSGRNSHQTSNSEIDYYDNLIAEARVDLIYAKTATEKAAIRSSIKAYEKLRADVTRKRRLPIRSRQYHSCNRKSYNDGVGMSSVGTTGIKTMSSIRGFNLRDKI